MATLVQFHPNTQSSTDAATLIAEYSTFERARMERRPWIHACLGFAGVILAGGAGGRLPAREALLGAVVFGAPLIPLVAAEMIGRRRLRRRLDRLRQSHHRIRKS